MFITWLSDRAVRVWGLGSWINQAVGVEKEGSMLRDIKKSDRIWPLMCIVLLCLATRVMWRRVEVDKKEEEEVIKIGKQKKAN